MLSKIPEGVVSIMSAKSPKPMIEEIIRQDPLELQYYSWYDTPAQLLRSEGASSRYFRDIYDLYRDMEDKDAQLFAVLQTRKNGVLARPRKIVAASDSPHDRIVADFVQQTLDDVGDFDGALLALLDAVGKGFAVLEILWKVQNGKIGIRALKGCPQKRFIIGADRDLRLVPSPFSTLTRRDADATTTSSPPFRNFLSSSPFLPDVRPGSSVPPRKFLHLTFCPSPESPCGRGLLARAYWYYWFKKNNLKFWVLFNEKFGAPTVIGKYRIGASEEERKRLHEVVESLQNDTGVTIPENVMLEYLEAKRSGTINTYRDLADWCNDEISKLVLGATLTTSEGRRSGSLALGQVHERVRSEYIEADSRALMGVIDGRLIRWLVDFNFGEDAPAPRLVIDTADDQNEEVQLRVDQDLVKLGVPLPLSYFYERYKRPAPKPADHAIRYDDNNLYQYHIQFGVLTINEVRQSLGLPPVPWGDRPPSPIPSTRGQKGGAIAVPLEETPEERLGQTKLETAKEK
jgi:phage gp29-like protein